MQKTIVALLEHMGKGLEDSTAMPTPEAMGTYDHACDILSKIISLLCLRHGCVRGLM